MPKDRQTKHRQTKLVFQPQNKLSQTHRAPSSIDHGPAVHHAWWQEGCFSRTSTEVPFACPTSDTQLLKRPVRTTTVIPQRGGPPPYTAVEARPKPELVTGAAVVRTSLQVKPDVQLVSAAGQDFGEKQASVVRTSNAASPPDVPAKRERISCSQPDAVGSSSLRSLVASSNGRQFSRACSENNVVQIQNRRPIVANQTTTSRPLPPRYSDPFPPPPTQARARPKLVHRRKDGVAKVVLSKEQEAILHMIVHEDKNVFFTGSAGTGKSVLLKEIIRALCAKYPYESDVAVTASTGIAACNIGGGTLHSFAGCGLANGTVSKLIQQVQKNSRSRDRWLLCKVLIVDVSMVEGALFDKLNAVGKAIRGNSKPFGGIQLVLTGDFFQLPPVGGNTVKYAFEAETWQECVDRSVQLTRVFRQRDEEFVQMLSEIRFGTMSAKTISAFKRLERNPKYPEDHIQPTHLFPTRGQSETDNQSRLGELPGEVRTFKTVDQCKDDSGLSKLDSSCLAPRILELKVDAQVMLLKNLDSDLVNGSRGVVLKFSDNGDPVVRFANGREVVVEQNMGVWEIEMPGVGVVASRRQIPLMLAWSMTVHKAQGQTIDRLKVDLSRSFESGQVYVALSRATSMASLQVVNFDPRKVRADPRVVAFMQTVPPVSVAG